MASAGARQTVHSALFDMTEVRLRVDRPTALVFWGDLHLGAKGTDHE